MRPPQQEFANPREWLIRLAEESGGYRRLVNESHGFGRAAYRLARARCQAKGGAEPCLDELQAAATLLANCLGSGGTLPIVSLLPGPRTQPPAALPRSPGVSMLPQTPVPPAPAQRRTGSKSRPHAARVSV
ncbi:MAG: hypothetical protein ABIQ16_19215 [Polyangiaceae bacterium]